MKKPFLMNACYRYFQSAVARTIELKKGGSSLAKIDAYKRRMTPTLAAQAPESHPVVVLQ